MTQQRIDLFNWVKEHHKNQVRKYTGESYYYHLENVYDIAVEFETHPLLYEVCICHDLIEDTRVNDLVLSEKLLSLGYTQAETSIIVSAVLGLTSVFTSDFCPELNRATRKRLEAHRLSTSNDLVQSVKYADIIDNLSTIVEKDAQFARTYALEKKNLLRVMNRGNFNLYLKACNAVYTCLIKVKN